MGKAEDRNENVDLGDGTYMIRNTLRNTCVILPHRLTPEEWNASVQNRKMTAADFESNFKMKSMKEHQYPDGKIAFSADGLSWYTFSGGRWLKLDPDTNTWGDPV